MQTSELLDKEAFALGFKNSLARSRAAVAAAIPDAPKDVIERVAALVDQCVGRDYENAQAIAKQRLPLGTPDECKAAAGEYVAHYNEMRLRKIAINYKNGCLVY